MGKTLDVKVRLRAEVEPELYEFFLTLPDGWRAEVMRLALLHAQRAHALPDMERIWSALGAKPVRRRTPRKQGSESASVPASATARTAAAPSAALDPEIIERMRRLNRFG